MNTKNYLTAILIFAVLYLSCISSHAQSNSDTIRLEKRGLGYHCYKDNEVLNFTQLTSLTHSNSEVATLLKASKNMQVGAFIFGCLGGGFMGYSVGYALGTVMRGNTLNNTLFFSMLGAGAVFAGIGIGFEVGANNKVKKAVLIYNKSIKQNNPQTLDLGISANGMMLRLNF